MKHNMLPLTLLPLLFCAAPARAGDGCVLGTPSIPDFDPTGVSLPIDITADPAMLVDVIEVSLDLTHPWVGDLVITLESPSGLTVTLIDQPGIPSDGYPGPFGCGGRDISADFTDSALIAAEDVCSYADRPVISGAVRPGQALAGFSGEPAAGTWLLHISDLFSYDVGLLNSACLNITLRPACPADLDGDGSLTVFDVLAYLTAFNSDDPAADLAAPFGTLNVFDVLAYLTAYNAGCP